MIAPHFERLSDQFKQAIFCKNDVDQSKAVAQAHNVSAMPTFVFVKNGSRVDELRGADVAGLQQRLIKHAGPAQPDFGASAGPVASGSGSPGSPAFAGAGAPSVSAQIDKAQSSCLNEAEAHGIKQLLTGGGYLESDADEQLIVSLATMQSLRLRALRFKTNPDHLAHAPKALKLFINRPTIGFDDAENDAATQEIELSKDQASGAEAVQLRFVLFQRVQSLQIFVSSNQGGEDTTRIDAIEVFGELGDAPSGSVADAMKHNHDH